jgi:TolB-like protein/Tfp pilus assembly protein PilF
MRIQFGDFDLDLSRRELRRGQTLLALEPQVLDLLANLLAHRERVVSKQELIDTVWAGRHVADATIASRIRTLRKALGDDGRSQAWIRTVHGRGFRFVGTCTGHAHMDAAGNAGAAGQVALPGGQPSIAVLPFQLLGSTPPWPTLHLALGHDLIAELSRLRWLRVTARASSFRFGPQDTEAAAQALGVRYLLAGSVEWQREQLGLSVELVEAGSGRLVWAERFSGRTGDVHALRAQVAARIPAALDLRIPIHEAERARLAEPGKLDAWLEFHVGLQHMYRFTATDTRTAAMRFAQAVALDPLMSRAHAGLSFVHFQSAFMNLSGDRARDVDLARRSAERAVELDPLDPFANFTLGRSHWLLGDLAGSSEWLDRAVSINPNFAQGLYSQAWREVLSGDARSARRNDDLAMQLSPLDPMLYAMLGVRAFTHLAEGDPGTAADWSERAARAPGAHTYMAMIAAAMNCLAGRHPQAIEWAGVARQLDGRLGMAQFLTAFPMNPGAMRNDMATALAKLGF